MLWKRHEIHDFQDLNLSCTNQTCFCENYLLKESSVKKMKSMWSRNELVLMFPNERRNPEFIQNSQEGSNRENFKVCFRNWSCIVATFLHILGSYWGCCSFLATEFCLWGGSEITSDTEQYLLVSGKIVLFYNWYIQYWCARWVMCALGQICWLGSEKMIRLHGQCRRLLRWRYLVDSKYF